MSQKLPFGMAAVLAFTVNMHVAFSAATEGIPDTVPNFRLNGTRSCRQRARREESR